MNTTQNPYRLRKRDRLSVKQTKWTLFTAFILGIVFSAAQLATDFHQERDRLNSTSRELIQVLDQPASFAAYNKDKKLSRELVVGYFSYHPTYKATISDSDGNVLASSTAELAQGPYRNAVDMLFGESRKFEQKLYFQPQPGSVLEMATLKEVGKLEIWIDSYSSGKIFLERAIRILVYGLLRNFTLAVVLLFIFHYFVSRPFNNIVGQLDKINPQVDTKTTISIPEGHQKDEFALLGSRMNQMLKKIDEHIESQMQQAREIEEVNIALLEAKEAAEAANEAKSNFLGIMSHELRTPMNGILGIAQVILSEETDEGRKDLCQLILSSGNRLNDILTEITTLTQLDSKSFQFEKRSFSLIQLEELLVTLFLSEASSKNLEITSE
ncbi:MAG: HAMP domain-containing sensor histidine kinase, partial [SAR324 cluster bacterium]|nr:HAMP domain-containing sensor histidine kinase [SAR324 cluster bacterium]